MKNFLSQHWDKMLFAFALFTITLAYGLVAGRYQIFPFGIVQQATLAAKDWRDNWATYTGEAPSKLLRPALYQGNGVVRHVIGKPQPGVTFMTGFRNGHVGLWLADLEGNTLHEWFAIYTEIWQNPTHVQGVEVPKHDFDLEIHGAQLFENGDVIFNFQNLGMAKLNKYGEVVWKLPYMTHHPFYFSKDGTLWVCGRKYHEQKNKAFPGMKPPFWEPIILQVSLDGEVLQEISLLEVMYENNKEALMFMWGERWYDWAHLNNVKVVEKDVAKASPLFEQGDLLVSFRNMNLLFVFDPKSKHIKWMQIGPWLNQHDPEFLSDGTISVFDNRRVRKWDWRKPLGGKSYWFDGSRIITIDPVTNETSTIYGGSKNEQFFFTNIMGEHQYLDNGNILITESEGGRVFEISSTGDTVWEYINRYDEASVAVIEQAQRYPLEYANFTKGVCQ